MNERSGHGHEAVFKVLTMVGGFAVAILFAVLIKLVDDLFDDFDTGDHVVA